ncbi:hypothetical protein EI94DRAFT_1808441 [Lactarius quietus]|nr:hypothetical protein EI94DRAFT_1808441 [Lactarius quietus]
MPECLDSSEADIIGYVYSPLASKQRNDQGLPVVDISEDSELVRSLITMLYPIPSEMPASYDRTLALLAAAHKYDMEAVQSSIRAEIAANGPSPTVDGAQAFRAYAIASRSRLTPEMETAALLTLDQP